jgi:hypothetical protein
MTPSPSFMNSIANNNSNSSSVINELYKLLASDGDASDLFGSSVAIDGNNIVVGSYLDDDNGAGSGSAYIFDVTTGNQLHKILATDGGAGDAFGFSVAIDGNNIVVGAFGEDEQGSISESAYVFNATTGNQLHKLTASDAATEDSFGRSVAISGNNIVVGAYFDDDNGSASGSAYIFAIS